MASTNFNVFKVPDRELLDSLSKLAKDCAADDTATVNLTLGKGHQSQISLPLSALKDNETVQKILSAESAIVWLVGMSLPKAGHCSISIQRQDVYDQATITFQDKVDPVKLAPVLAAAHRNLRPYARTESTDKLLGTELAEFYRRREEGLLRLEELTQKLIEQNEEYRRRLDKEKEDYRKQLRDETDAGKERLQGEHTERAKALQSREQELEKRQREVDDRSSRHARRALRQDLKGALAKRSEKFTLTAKTGAKRIPIHVLFLLLIVASGAFLTESFLMLLKTTLSDPGVWYVGLKTVLSGVAFAAAVVYYIRWNDQWFRQHADEEFRLKRLELDIDRASWVVEMALEWKEEKGRKIPEELVDRLSRNLFVGEAETHPVRHPNEDLASALLGASSGLALRVPGLGHLTLTRRGLKRFKAAASEIDEPEG